jgi:hypothetical protein
VSFNKEYKKMSSIMKILDRNISMSDIKIKAKALGIEPGNMKKPELIHAIQKAEGYTPCFGTSNGHCPYTDCCFIKDCLKIRH